MAFVGGFGDQDQFGFLDGITILSFLMQCENNKDINNKDLLNLVHQDILALASQLTRVEQKLDKLLDTQSIE